MDAVLGLDTSCYTTSAAAVDALGSAQEADLETILAADAAARAFVREHCSK